MDLTASGGMTARGRGSILLPMDLSDLDRHGAACLPALLSPHQCAEMIALWDRPELFRKEVVMARHGYGSGRYRYFAYPLPELVTSLRTTLYPALAEVANRWAMMMDRQDILPARHADFLTRCALGGQDKATPLLLRYETGDWNALHQDIYGPHIFPLQLAVLLSAPERDFTGGAFVLTEQRPRMQSRPEVVPLSQGDAVVFPVRERPVKGARGTHQLQMRHGVSRLMSGVRYALGLIFHDAD